jgi:hypothetical protein
MIPPQRSHIKILEYLNAHFKENPDKFFLAYQIGLYNSLYWEELSDEILPANIAAFASFIRLHSERDPRCDYSSNITSSNG